MYARMSLFVFHTHLQFSWKVYGSSLILKFLLKTSLVWILNPELFFSQWFCKRFLTEWCLIEVAGKAFGFFVNVWTIHWKLQNQQCTSPWAKLLWLSRGLKTSFKFICFSTFSSKNYPFFEFIGSVKLSCDKNPLVWGLNKNSFTSAKVRQVFITRITSFVRTNDKNSGKTVTTNDR